MSPSKDKTESKSLSNDGSGDVVSSFKRGVNKFRRRHNKESPNGPEIHNGQDQVDRGLPFPEVEAQGGSPQQAEAGPETFRAQGRQQSFRPNPAIPPLSPGQNYPLKEEREGAGTTISDQTHHLSSGERRHSEESYVRGEQDYFDLSTKPDQIENPQCQSIPNGAKQVRESDGGSRAQQAPNRKSVGNSTPEAGRPLPLPPFGDAVKNQFLKESRISVNNDGDRGLVKFAVEEVIAIATREMQLREGYANKSQQKTDPNENQEIIKPLQMATKKHIEDAEENDATIGNLRALRSQDKTTLNRKDKELADQASRIQALEDDLREYKEKLASSEKVVQKAAEDIENLKRLQTETEILERTYKNALQRKEKDLNEAHQQNIRSLESRHELNLADLKENHIMRTSEKDAIHHKSISDLKEEHTNTTFANQRAHALAVSALEDQVKKITSDMTQLIASHEAASKKALREYKAKLERQQSEYDDELESLTRKAELVKSDADSREQSLIASHESQKDQMSRKHNSAIAKLKQEKSNSEAVLISQHSEAQGSLIAQHEEAKELLLTQHQDVKEKLEKDKADQEEAKAQALEALAEQHKAEKQYMQRQVQDLNAALLNRDEEEYRGTLFKSLGLPKKPDEKLREMFGEIQHMVEDLGRLAWKPKQSLWTDALISKIQGRNVLRVLKKAIVQDLVWTLLYQAIFMSPFRIFGEEGETLESEWFEQCSQDTPVANEKYPWPAPGAHAERWRYMTMRECREALIKPASKVDPRTRLREGFVSSVESLSELLKDELGSMVELGVEHSQTVDKLSKRAAAIWTDFEMHRCRILVSLSGSEAQPPEKKIEQLRKGSLALTISPRLGRYGTTKGTELDRFMVIDGCGGDSLKIP